MKVDAEKGDGVDLAKQYNVHGYPTVVFVQNDGKEIDRIVGYLPPKSFLDELKRIDGGEDTYISLVKQVKETPQDVDVLIKYANKLQDRQPYSEEGRKTWQLISSLSKPETKEHTEAQFRVAQFQSVQEKSSKPLKEYIADNPESPYLINAYTNLVGIQKGLGNKEAEASAYKKAVEVAEKQNELTPNLLNGYAWRMTELELNLKDALTRAKQAVEMVQDKDPQSQAQIMDTEAEVLWKSGKADKAIEVMNQCIELQPTDDYYQKQLAKFQGKTTEEQAS